MELVALYQRAIGLGIHQAQITACALIEQSGRVGLKIQFCVPHRGQLEAMRDRKLSRYKQKPFKSQCLEWSLVAFRGFSNWCPGEDLNLHYLSITST